MSIPFLPSLSGLLNIAHAQSMSPVKRFISLRSSQGDYRQHQFPNDTLLPLLTLAQGVKGFKLKDLPGPISPVWGAEFDPYRDKMTIINNLTHMIEYGKHNSGMMLGSSGVRSDSSNGSTVQLNETIDQVLARKIYSEQPLLTYLNVKTTYKTGAGFSSIQSVALRDGAYRALPAIKGEQALFDKVFGQFSGGDQNKATQLSQEKLAVDMVLDSYKKMRNHRRISSVDKQNLDIHIENLFQVQSRINRLNDITCAAPPRPAALDGSRDEYAYERFKIITDLIIACLVCDLTRVVNIHLDLHDANITDGLHSLHHTSDINYAMPKMLEAHRSYSKQVAYMVKRMSEVPDPVSGKSLLDASLIIHGKEMSCGNIHNCQSPPVVLFGGVDGYLKTGQYLDYSNGKLLDTIENNQKVYWGRPYNELLITIMKSFGLQPSDWESNGEMGYGQYSPKSQVVIGDKRASLPGLVA